MIGWVLGKVTGVAEFGRLGGGLLGPAEAAEAAGAWARDVSSVPQGQEERKKGHTRQRNQALGRDGGVRWAVEAFEV